MAPHERRDPTDATNPVDGRARAAASTGDEPRARGRIRPAAPADTDLQARGRIRPVAPVDSETPARSRPHPAASADTLTPARASGLPFPAYPHEVLGVVLSVRDGALAVLLWRRTRAPQARRWALPGGGVEPDQRLREAITAHLEAKVDVNDVAWLEQVATHSKVDRDPRARVMATGYLALVPAGIEPQLPSDTAWFDVAALPPTAFDHHYFVDAAVERLRAKLSYTNIGFALAPERFTIHQLRDIIGAALGYDVDATNLARVLTRRGTIAVTGETATSGPCGGRPAAVYRFCSRTLEVTDPFATLRPPDLSRS